MKIPTMWNQPLVFGRSSRTEILDLHPRTSRILQRCLT